MPERDMERERELGLTTIHESHIDGFGGVHGGAQPIAHLCSP